MAKRHQEEQLTKDNYEVQDSRLEQGGPDSSVDPVKLASSDVMKRRPIKQPKSRFSAAGATTPGPQPPTFSFDTSTTPATPPPAPISNGSSVGLFGATTPATPFAGFSTLNGGTPATPALHSPTKSANPFASLNSTTPAGKPPAGLFDSLTPAGMPKPPAAPPMFGGSPFNYNLLKNGEAKKDEAKDAAKPRPTFGGVSEFNFPSTAAKGDEAGEAAKPKPTFGGVSEFKFPTTTSKTEAAGPKPTFAGVSTFSMPKSTATEASNTSKPQPTFGGKAASSIFKKDTADKKNTEEPEKKPANPFTSANPFAGVLGGAAKSATTPAAAPATPAPISGGLFGSVPSTASAGLFGSSAKIGETKKADAGLFGIGSKVNESSSAPAAGLFGIGSKASEPLTPSAGLFGSKSYESPAPSGGMFGGKSIESPAPSGLFGSKPKEPPAPSAGLFGSKSNESPAPSGLFGSKLKEPPAPSAGLFGSKTEESSKPAPSGDLFGSKAPISLNATPDFGGVKYPALPSASSITAPAAPLLTNGSATSNTVAPIQFDVEAPPPPEHCTEEEKEEFDRLYKIKVLNAAILKALQTADSAGDWRAAFRIYETLYEQIAQGTKRKDESQINGPAASSKRSKTDEPRGGSSAAAAMFSSIVDKNVGQSTTTAAKKAESQPKELFGGFKPQQASTSTSEKPAASSVFGNPFSTPSSSATITASASPTPPKATSALFGAGGGAAVSAPAASGGLFSNLKPVLSDQKDKGEEDLSPQKPRSGSLLFGSGDSSAPPPQFLFNSATPEKPTSGGLFGTPNAGGDQTWKPDTPIKFGGSSSTTGGLFSSSSTNTAPSLFSFTSSNTSTNAPSTGLFSNKPTLAPPSISRGTSYDGLGSGFTTPGATSSDPESSKPAATTIPTTTSCGNEPSDEVRSDKLDMSGSGPGEENDEVLFTLRVAVYVKADKGMKKIAVGASRVLKDRDTGKPRFLVRTEQGKVALNVRLQKQVDYTVLPQKNVILIPDFSMSPPKTYTVRAKDPLQVAEMGRIIAEVKC